MAIFLKDYSSKATAVRGAKRANLDEGSFEVTQNAETGRWDLFEIDADDNEAAEDSKGKGGVYKDIPVRRRSEFGGATKEVWNIAEGCFHSAEELGLPTPTRKEVIAACVERGIAFYTARTQYQLWRSLLKEEYETTGKANYLFG